MRKLLYLVSVCSGLLLGIHTYIDYTTSEASLNGVKRAAKGSLTDRVVSIHANYEGLCSGYMLTENLILTAGHCIDKTSKYQDVTIGDEIKVFKVYKADFNNDVAIMTNGKATRTDLRLALAQFDCDCMGDEVISLGYGGGDDLDANAGVINGRGTFNYHGGDVDISGDLYRGTAELRGGMSGGPVFNQDGLICGNNVGQVSPPSTNRSQYDKYFRLLSSGRYYYSPAEYAVRLLR